MKSSPKRAEGIKVPESAIRKLSEILRSTDLAEIEIAEGPLSIRVRAKEGSPQVISVPTAPAHISPVASAPVRPASQENISSDLHVVRSPFVGTFYRAPSPNSPSFVEVGQTVSKGSVLCIIEAMKIMNEIEADSGGVIEKIFVENGAPVDFNAPLFSLRKI